MLYFFNVKGMVSGLDWSISVQLIPNGIGVQKSVTTVRKPVTTGSQSDLT